MTSIASPTLWISFGVLVVILLAFDLFVLGGAKARAISMRQALTLSLLWIFLALIFNLGLWIYLSQKIGSPLANESALNFFTGYLIEKSLSVDNLFVFLMIFNALHIPRALQKRVFMYGIVGAIVLRGVMIALGATLVKEFSWILYLFGAFLLITGVKMAFSNNQTDGLQNNRLIRFCQKHLRMTDKLEGEHFFIIKNGLLYATPLFLVLVLIEFSDLVFATDSIPAIFAITQDAFIVFSSNVFAILGLRALYFLLSGMLDRFCYLHYGLSCILSLIGIKLLIADFYKIPSIAVLLAVFVILLGSAFFSLMFPKNKA